MKTCFKILVLIATFSFISLQQQLVYEDVGEIKYCNDVLPYDQSGPVIRTTAYSARYCNSLRREEFKCCYLELKNGDQRYSGCQPIIERDYYSIKDIKKAIESGSLASTGYYNQYIAKLSGLKVKKLDCSSKYLITSFLISLLLLF